VNDVAELRQFVVVHARAQGIPAREYGPLLAAIERDEGSGPGSWTGAWIAAGERREQRGDLLGACRRYNMARFPYVDGPARQDALDRCVAAFDRWRARAGIERLEVPAGGATVPCWATGLSAARRQPLLIVMGGIVSIKEQWAPVLVQARRLGLAGLVAELPGVGQNPLRYGESSRELISQLLDGVAGRADVSRCYAVALSFSGHLALDAAAADSRIRGVITAGAPVRAFFTDPAWARRVPRITADTLAHISGAPRAEVFERLRGLALSDARLRAVRVPVYAAVSRRDEIIPEADAWLLRRHVADLRPVEYDDVHGSPAHVAESRLWIIRSLLELRGGRPAQRAVVGALLRAQRARRRPGPVPGTAPASSPAPDPAGSRP
jgi:esterase FrsA